MIPITECDPAGSYITRLVCTLRSHPTSKASLNMAPGVSELCRKLFPPPIIQYTFCLLVSLCLSLYNPLPVMCLEFLFIFLQLFPPFTECFCLVHSKTPFLLQYINKTKVFHPENKRRKYFSYLNVSKYLCCSYIWLTAIRIFGNLASVFRQAARVFQRLSDW